jgi:uncharacterized membrane protein
LEDFNLLIGLILGVFGVIAYIKGFFSWSWSGVKGLFFSSPENVYQIPNKTLTIIKKAGAHNCWWHMGKSGGKPAMQIVAKFMVTNICKFNVLPVLVKMKKPENLGHVMIRKHDENFYGRYMIPDGTTTDLSIDFWVIPPVRKEGDPFKADLAVVDQFGNEQGIMDVNFEYR